MNLVFASRAPVECKKALEELLFFNPRQHRVREGILHSLQTFGHPRVEATPHGLSIRVGDQEAQTLFAFDRARLSSEPVGVIVFLRTAPEEIGILHVAVEQEYALHGKQAGLGVGVSLVEKVKEIASRIAGIQRLIFYYRREVVIRI